MSDIDSIRVGNVVRYRGVAVIVLALDGQWITQGQAIFDAALYGGSAPPSKEHLLELGFTEIDGKWIFKSDRN